MEFNDLPNLLGYKGLIELIKGPKPQTTRLLRKTELIQTNSGDLGLAFSITPPESASHRF